MKLNEYINEKLILSKNKKHINDYAENNDEENILNYKEFLNYIKIQFSSNYYLSIKDSIEYKIGEYEKNYYKKLDKGEIETDNILDQICIDLNNDNFDKVKHLYGNDIKKLYYSNTNDFGVYLWKFWGPDEACKFIIISDIENKTSEVFEIINKK